MTKKFCAIRAIIVFFGYSLFLKVSNFRDDKLREIARIRERALHDEASYIADAKAEGRAEGRAELFETFRNMGADEELLKRVQEAYANKG